MKALPFRQDTPRRVRLVTVEQSWFVAEGRPITLAAEAFAALQPYFVTKDREHLVTLHLDGSHRPVSAEVVSVGTLTMAPVHPREVFKAALLANALAIIVAHNHPSGDITPSAADRDVFHRLIEAGKLLDIPVLDFLIVGPTSFVSLAETC